MDAEYDKFRQDFLNDAVQLIRTRLKTEKAQCVTSSMDGILLCISCTASILLAFAAFKLL